MTEDEMERAVRRLLDKDEIVDLIHEYSYLVDRRLYDELLELFTEDCVADYGPGVGPSMHGRAELSKMFGSRFVATSHHNANVLIDFESDDRASVRSTVYAWHAMANGARPEIWGCYEDVVQRSPGGWKIAQRKLRVAGNENIDIGWWPLIDSDEPKA